MESLEEIKTPGLEPFRDQMRRHQQEMGISGLCGNLLDDVTDFKRPLEPGSGDKSALLSYTGDENLTSSHAVHPLVSVVDDFTN